MSWWFLGLVMGVIVVLIAATSMFNSLQDQIDKVTTELNELKTQIAEIEADIDKVTTELNELKTQIAEIEADIESHNKRIKAFNKKVSAREYQNERRLK